MRKAEKRQAEEFVKMLGLAHDEIEKSIEQKKFEAAMDLLEQCQEGAIRLGELIEAREGEQFVTIPLLEEYCEVVYQIHEELAADTTINAHNAYKKLKNSLVKVSNSVKNDIKARLEVLFLPYKASMWDSLESIWMAADADPECDAYVVPIPYYERNADHSLGKFHYEGVSFPEYVPVTYYDSYSIEERQPDIIYIHNPYDDANYVTSIDLRYYSWELKKHTKKLVYVPYYSTSGGMSEGQALCSAYLHVDHIVVQAEKYRKFFDPRVQDKLLVLGSPKFDKVIRLCQDPPEPPVGWKEKMVNADGTRKKVYFYNTSIGGMLADTRRFLQKMEYVFENFKGREDACLLWRPHPLLESTFDSMRPQLKPLYVQLKNKFFEEQLGIYDDTPDIGETIALCDAYIGDAGTSVTSLFGVAGKPLFILNNYINTFPEEDDWRGETTVELFWADDESWLVTPGNKLYYAPGRDHCYEFYCNLSDKTTGAYYLKAVAVNDKIYVCPWSAQDVLVVRDHKIVKRISLERKVEHSGAFYNAWLYDPYLYLIPEIYPAIVRIDTRTDEVIYLEGYNDIFTKNVPGVRKTGGSCVWNGYLFIASPTDGQVLVVEAATGKTQLLQVGKGKSGGCFVMVPEKEYVWILPYEGTTIIRWNPLSGEEKSYNAAPSNFQCIHAINGYPCAERPFTSVAEGKDKIILSPSWGNMFVAVDLTTGEAEEWLPPYKFKIEPKNGYYVSWDRARFLRGTDTFGEGTWRLLDMTERRLYDINVDTGKWKEIGISFNRDEVEKNEPGFSVCSDWLQYACMENGFYAVKDFLDGAEIGTPFNRELQEKAYGEIATNGDGTCGEKIHVFVTKCFG